jgi:hypothetical protein
MGGRRQQKEGKSLVFFSVTKRLSMDSFTHFYVLNKKFLPCTHTLFTPFIDFLLPLGH